MTKENESHKFELLTEVQTIIDQLSKKFPVPKDKIDRAKKIKVSVIKKEQLAQKIINWLSYMKIVDLKFKQKTKLYDYILVALETKTALSLEAGDQYLRSSINGLLNQFGTTGGVTLSFGQHDEIFLNAENANDKEIILRQEIIRALSGNSFKANLSHNEIEGANTINHNLNERTIQLLELFNRYELDELRLLDKIMSKEISTEDQRAISILLMAMICTNCGSGIQVGINVLAENYFSDQNKMEKNTFIPNLKNKISDSVAGSIEALLIN